MCCSRHRKNSLLPPSPSLSSRPIHDAIESGNLELLQLLLSYGADPMAEIGEKTPVEYALANNQMEIHAFLQGKYYCDAV